MIADSPTMTAVICTYTEDRYALLCQAIDSLANQTRPAEEILVVVDHNPALLERIGHDRPNVRVIANSGPQGLSGARNSGLDACHTTLIGFLDDDATAELNWIATLIEHFANPSLVGVGSAVVPVWEAARPDWLTHEFDWVVGCSYEGLPTVVAPVRNPMGGAMVFRLAAAATVGGFRTDLGRVGSTPLGCEETEFYIRLNSKYGEGTTLYDPRTSVSHFVPARRGTWRYYARRCFGEGLSKAVVASLGGTSRGDLAVERRHLTRTIPRAVGRELRHGRVKAVAGIVVGVVATSYGYILGRLRSSTRELGRRPVVTET
jgi:glycosyltransferase involved in cell wall biosynthesis